MLRGVVNLLVYKSETETETDRGRDDGDGDDGVKQWWSRTNAGDQGS